jgi:hypothetical protein
MSTSIHAAGHALASVPGYCTSGHGILTSSEWTRCAKLGWSEPVNTSLTHTGSTIGSDAVPVAVVFLVILALIFVARAVRRTPAAQRS